MFLVHKDASDPPLRKGRRVFVVLALVLDIREFFGTAVLAPALYFPAFVVNKCRVSSSCLYSVFFSLAIIELPLAALGVVRNAPAAAIDPVISLDEFREGVPRRCAERTD
jgi:hypothetical protein